MEQLIDLLQVFFRIYWFCIIGWVLISWLPMISPQMAYNSTVTSIRRFLDSVVLPYVRLFRFIPPVRIGGALIDLSSLVAIFAFTIVSGLIISILRSAAGVPA